MISKVNYHGLNKSRGFSDFKDKMVILKPAFTKNETYLRKFLLGNLDLKHINGRGR